MTISSQQDARGNKFKRLTSADRAHYEQHILAQEKSNVNQSAYCKQHGLNFNTFCYQRTRVLKSRNANKGNAFIPLKSIVSKHSTLSAYTLKLKLANGCVLEISADLNCTTLTDILTAASKLK